MRRPQIARAASWTVLAVYALTFSEWLFFATMPSVISRLSFLDMLQVLAATALWLSLHGLALSIAVSSITVLLPARSATVVMSIVPSLVVTALALLMADNFTTTLLGIGLARISGIPLTFYGVASAAVAISLIPWFARRIRTPRFWLVPLAGMIVSLSIGAVTFRILGARHLVSFFDVRRPSGDLPHIFLIGVDGLDANRTSFYGYERATTPAIDSFRREALYAENAFTTAGNTRTAINSILTGKSPMTTGVYGRGAFSGRDSFEHLPAILRSLGYTSVQAGTEHWVDGHHVNMRMAFDSINGEETRDPWPAWVPDPIAIRFSPDFFLADTILSRVERRALHLARVAKMPDPLSRMEEPPRVWRDSDADDEKRVSDVLRFLATAEAPVFAHIHLLSTHCCDHFAKQNRFWRHDMTRAERREAKFDNTVREADDYVAILIDHLRKERLLDKTIIVFYSDHGRRWRSMARVPLVFRFPEGRHAGKLRNVASLLDIAPTLLDYLEQPKPDWMEGHSLISAGFETIERSIFALSPPWPGVPDGERRTINLRSTMSHDWEGGITYIECDRWHDWNGREDALVSGIVAGYTGPCKHSAPPSPEEVAAIMLENLSRYDSNRTQVLDFQ